MEQKIISTIETGAQWEIWLQVEIVKALREKYGSFARELRLDGGQSTDIGVTINEEHYLIELKVESATNAGDFAGKSLKNAVNEDINKLRRIGIPARKWVVCVAWSPVGKEALQYFGFDYICYGDIYIGIKRVG